MTSAAWIAEHMTDGVLLLPKRRGPVPRFVLPIADMIATEGTTQMVRIEQTTGTLYQLQAAIRYAMRYHGYRVHVLKDGEHAVRVCVKGRR
jgi:hypothetical protein